MKRLFMERGIPAIAIVMSIALFLPGQGNNPDGPGKHLVLWARDLVLQVLSEPLKKGSFRDLVWV